jgi:transcriptional regulator with XRE-family HTH domain
MKLPNKETFNYALHRAIKESGLTQKAVAESTGIDQGTMSKIISKRINPTPDEMKAIASTLHIPVPQLWPDA